MHQFLKFIFGIELYMLRTGFLSIIRSLVLYDIYLLVCLQYSTPDDGQKTCPQHVEFYSKNKFKKLVHPIGFIIRIIGYKYSVPPNSRDTITMESNTHLTEQDIMSFRKFIYRVQKLCTLVYLLHKLSFFFYKMRK
jgi:hypothetical protein